MPARARALMRVVECMFAVEESEEIFLDRNECLLVYFGESLRMK